MERETCFLTTTGAVPRVHMHSYTQYTHLRSPSKFKPESNSEDLNLFGYGGTCPESFLATMKLRQEIWGNVEVNHVYREALP